MTKADVAELARLDASSAGGAVGFSQKQPARETAFRCDMLMARGGAGDGDDAWRCMSCEDACDYVALSLQAFGFFDKVKPPDCPP